MECVTSLSILKSLSGVPLSISITKELLIPVYYGTVLALQRAEAENFLFLLEQTAMYSFVEVTNRVLLKEIAISLSLHHIQRLCKCVCCHWGHWNWIIWRASPALAKHIAQERKKVFHNHKHFSNFMQKK